MESGLLWFDDDPRKKLEEKVQRAAMHYERKFGEYPTLCFVHPSALGDQAREQQAGHVAIRARQAVLPNHFWLGIDDEPPARQAGAKR